MKQVEANQSQGRSKLDEVKKEGRIEASGLQGLNGQFEGGKGFGRQKGPYRTLPRRGVRGRFLAEGEGWKNNRIWTKRNWRQVVEDDFEGAPRARTGGGRIRRWEIKIRHAHGKMVVRDRTGPRRGQAAGGTVAQVPSVSLPRPGRIFVS